MKKGGKGGKAGDKNEKKNEKTVADPNALDMQLDTCE